MDDSVAANKSALYRNGGQYLQFPGWYNIIFLPEGVLIYFFF